MSEAPAGPADPTPAPVPSAALRLTGADRARNVRLVQLDSAFVGTLTASGTFLPVFLVRLGANGTQVGLVSAISATAAVCLAIPAGRWLQGKADIVRWYSRLRMTAWTSYALMGLAGLLLPPPVAIPAILAIWALWSIPATSGQVVFPIVMDGIAGPSGRFDLLGRRWSIAGVATAIAVALAGQWLELVAFPLNFAILLAGFTLAGVGSFLVSRRFVVPRKPRLGGAESGAAGSGGAGPGGAAVGTTDPATRRPRVAVGVGQLVGLVRSHPTFVGFEARSIVFTAALGLTMPLLPLFYVNEVKASDAWVGIIGAAGSAGQVLGYTLTRRVSLRREGRVVLVPALLAVAATPAILASVDLLPVVAALALVTGLATAAAQLSLFDQLMGRIPRDHDVTFVSVDQTLQNLALVVGPFIGGTLEVVIGVRWGLVVAAAVGLLAALLFAADRRATRRG